MTTTELRQAIEANLKGFDRIRSSAGLRPAAVAVVVVAQHGEPAVPMFERTANMRRHPGQMALPGGVVHAGESIEECARRELAEEVGLTPDRVETLGMLDDFETVSGFAITPVVMWSTESASELHPSADEVAHLFIVLLTDLRRAVAEAHPGESDRFSLRLTEVEVFAPTAAMLYQFSEVALDGRSARVGSFFQPPWTHR